MRKPSKDFESIGADIFWGDISRDYGRSTPTSETAPLPSEYAPQYAPEYAPEAAATSRAVCPNPLTRAVLPHSQPDSVTYPEMYPDSHAEPHSEPYSETRSDAYLNPRPAAYSDSGPRPVAPPPYVDPRLRSTIPPPPEPTSQAPTAAVTMLGGLSGWIDRTVRAELAPYITPENREPAARPDRTSPSRRRRKPQRSTPALYVATLGLGLLGFAGFSNWEPRSRAVRHGLDCASVVQVDATLAPEVVAELPAKIGQAKAEVAQALGAPYCSLPKLSIRHGAIVERDLYQTADERRVVVSYEEGTLLGVGIELVDDRGDLIAIGGGLEPIDALSVESLELLAQVALAVAQRGVDVLANVEVRFGQEFD